MCFFFFTVQDRNTRAEGMLCCVMLCYVVRMCTYACIYYTWRKDKGCRKVYVCVHVCMYLEGLKMVKRTL